MDEIKEFQVILQIIVSRLVRMISKEMNLSGEDALNLLYLSLTFLDYSCNMLI